MIVVTGSLAFDFIMNFPGKFSDHILAEKIHTINLSFLVKNLRRERGGCAANIAYNLALLGEKPAILGVLGHDGVEYKKWLAAQGIDVSLLRIYRAKGTSSAFIMTDSADNQITGFYPGAMDASAELRISKLSNCEFIDLVIIAPNAPKTMINFAKECQELKIPYLFDPGMQLPYLSKKDLIIGIQGAKIIIGNDYEMSLIKSRLENTLGSGKQAVKTSRGWPDGLPRGGGIKKDQIWITTLGANGSIIEHEGKKIRIRPAKPKNVSDPTGAGDAYRAGFIYGYIRGYDLKTAGQLGSLTAVYTVEKYGTTTHRFTKKTFEKRYRVNYNETILL